MSMKTAIATIQEYGAHNAPTSGRTVIAIVNRGHPPSRFMLSEDDYMYEVKVNDEHIAYFRHARSEGLAACLARAYQAVEKKHQPAADQEGSEGTP